MNIKGILGAVGGVLLAFAVGYGLSAWKANEANKTRQTLEDTIQTIVQKSIDTRFDQFNKDYKDGIKQALAQQAKDQADADAANRLLNNGSPSWVWVQPTDQESTCATNVGTSTGGSNPPATVRTQLSDKTSLPLKREAQRADQCAVDYNKLRGDYSALRQQVKDYNNWVATYNAQFAK